MEDETHLSSESWETEERSQEKSIVTLHDDAEGCDDGPKDGLDS